MTRQSFSRMAKVSTALLMAVLFGFPGVAMANQANIRYTGPDSYNKIEFNNEESCIAENHNNVKASNHVTQNAQTGDATVGGSGWEAYSPEAWQASGHSYEEWESAVNTYLAQNKHDWKNKWDSQGGNTTGGSATSGDATNNNSNHTNVSIDNSDACDTPLLGNNSSSMPNSNQTSSPGRVLGSTSINKNGGGSGGNGHTLGAGASEDNLSGVLGANGSYQGEASRLSNLTIGGGAGGSGTDGGGSGGNNFSINNTGPDSYNKISYDRSYYTNVSNTNNVVMKNVVTQNASSGNASVSGNTTSGTAGSGGTHNSNNLDSETGINN